MQREYWTYLDNSNNHYEISNFGRVRNASTQRVLSPTWSDKRKAFEFGIHYKDTPYKKVNLKRAVLNHFGGELLKNEFVRVSDPTKTPSLENLEIYTWTDIEKPKKKRKDCKPQNAEIWEKSTKTCRIIAYKQWGSICKSYGVNIEDLTQEALLYVIEDYDSYNDGENFFKFCRTRVRRAFRELIFNAEDIDGYLIAKRKFNEDQ